MIPQKFQNLIDKHFELTHWYIYIYICCHIIDNGIYYVKINKNNKYNRSKGIMIKCIPIKIAIKNFRLNVKN